MAVGDEKDLKENKGERAGRKDTKRSDKSTTKGKGSSTRDGEEGRGND